MKFYNDFSQYMTTGPLLKSSWLLANDTLSVFINTTKPSIRGLFAYGKMGRLHNLLFDMDCQKLYSDLYGIYPYYKLNGKNHYPFRTGVDIRSSASFDTSGNREISVLPDENKITFENLTMFEEKTTSSDSFLPAWSIAIEGNSLHIKAKFPKDAEDCGIHLPWYPIYDKFRIGDEKKNTIQYHKHGIYEIYPDYFCEDYTEDITLEDTLSRQASVKVCVKEGRIRLRSCTRPEYGHALYLSTDAVSSGSSIDLVITLIPPKVTVTGEHYYPCGSSATVSIFKNGTHSEYTFIAASDPGVHTIQLDDITVFTYCAVPNDADMMKLAADACRKIFWKEGNLEGAPPYAFDPTTLEPNFRFKHSYCSHGMRCISSLAAEAVRSGDISYAEAALYAIQKVEALSYHGDDGHVFTPLLMTEDGDPRNNRGSCRPSDSGIIIRGLIHTAKAFLHFGANEKAKECVVLANNYSKTISKMQCSDGSFYDRYYYPTLEPSITNKGTVNNWCLQLWNLIPLLRHFRMDDDAVRLDTLVKKYIGYQIGKENSILYISGGGEDASDFGDALNTDATLFTMQYILTQDPAFKEYALQALKKSWLMSCMWADMPQYFGLYGNSDIGEFYDQPIGLFSAGGMHDLTAVEANLFVSDALENSFASDMADALHNARLGSFIRQNGGMYMVMLQCPGYYYRDERHSEMLMYGGVGVYAWHTAHKNSLILREMNL